MMDREKAIEVLQRMADDKTEELHICDDEGGSVCGLILEEQNAILAGIEALKEQRPHGEWKYEPKLRLVDETDDGAIYETEMKCFCSACGADFGFRKVDDAFCKYCGADMRQKEGESE